MPAVAGRPRRAFPTICAMKAFDVQVHGAGIVGMSLALALARLGLTIALRDDAPTSARPDDVRAYALNPVSIALLRSLKVWDALPPNAATAVYEMQVEGDAPGAELEFSAWEQRVGALAWITDAALLERELASAIRFSPHVTRTATEVEAPLSALCEGRESTRRDALGVGFSRHAYGQRAIAARVTATQPHRGIARQWFRSPDVLALLPFDAPQAGASYAVVWSLPDDRAAGLLALDCSGFEQALVQATGGACGELKLASERAAWTLQLGRADHWVGPGWALLGDAAHVVHPLAGQGLNLGLADVVALSRVIEQREPWRPLGDERLLRRYARERAAPTWAMGEVTDGLLRLFSQDSSALRELRNRGLTLVNRVPLAKRWLASQALGS